MQALSRPSLTILFLTSSLLAVTASAQHDAPSTPQPNQHERASPVAKDAGRVGVPYPLATCPITGKKLGTMGDPPVKVYDGREVRFCCAGCIGKFEKDKAANFAKIDGKIIHDQGPLYPVKTSPVTGKDLPAKPYEFVYGHRLVRLGAEGEKAAFLKDATKHIAALDKAAVEAQGKDYPLKSCPVSKEALGGEMGKPVDLVIAGRLIRLCCESCTSEVDKNPATFIALIDAARKGDAAKPDAAPNEGHGGHKHGGG